ncbi:hypothetical protein [Nocardia cerradoensis]|nr:hypothetical protein [Nocardia cerradoensis]
MTTTAKNSLAARVRCHRKPMRFAPVSVGDRARNERKSRSFGVFERA